MKANGLVSLFVLSLVLEGAARADDTAKPQYPNFPSETPTTLTPVTDSWDHARREVMIPMRDGVKLHTIILVPKGARGAGMLLTRTPYDAKELTGHTHSGHLGPMLQGYDNATDVDPEQGNRGGTPVV